MERYEVDELLKLTPEEQIEHDKYVNGTGGIFGSGIQSFAVTWDNEIKAPDKTMGYWKQRANVSGGAGSKNMGA